MNSEEDEFKRIEAEALRLWAAQTDDDDTQVYAKPWVGLTDEDWEHIDNKKGTALDTFTQGAVWAEARLKERNHD